MCSPRIDKVGRHSCSVVFWRFLGWISMEIWKIRKKVTVEVNGVYLTNFPQTLALQVGKKIKCSNTQKSEHSRFKNKSLNTPGSKTKVLTLHVHKQKSEHSRFTNKSLNTPGSSTYSESLWPPARALRSLSAPSQLADSCTGTSSGTRWPFT